MAQKAVQKYNFELPHKAIGKISPNQFEMALAAKNLCTLFQKEKK
jgi:hypothetical protein